MDLPQYINLASLAADVLHILQLLTLLLVDFALYYSFTPFRLLLSLPPPSSMIYALINNCIHT